MVRRALDLVILTAAVAITLLAILVLTGGRQGEAYQSSPLCKQHLDALIRPCWTKVLVTVEDATIVHHGKIGPAEAHLVLDWPAVSPSPFTVVIPQPTKGFYALHHGDTAVLKVWNGVPTAVFTLDNLAMRTPFNPLSADELALWGGFSLLGVGLIILVVHPVAWLLPKRFRLSGERVRRWQPTVGMTGDIFSDPRLRVAVVGLIVLNLMDIASSILGGKVGLYESNPIAANMVEQWGPLGGFFSLKLPALIAIILAVTKLPHRVALILAYAGCIVMMYVVIGNVVLVQGSSSPSP